MMEHPKRMRSAALGALLVVTSLSVAYTAGRSKVAVEEAPMEELLEAASDVYTAKEEWDLPVTRNEAVDRWIGFLSGRNADKTQVWLERKGMYGPMIRAELRKRGMPEDLLYLALIESGLSPKAYSKAHASGMWQFISETGRRYGLQQAADLDERRDPVKSTGAALTYLQELYDRFGSWYLAAAAYNTGENRVGRIMRETFGTERGTDEHFWRIAHRLPRETRDYVPLMLAAAHIGKDPAQFGLGELSYHEPLAYDEVEVPAGTDLVVVARASGVEASAVVDLNPHLTRGRTPASRAYVVRIPAGTRVAFDASFAEVHREWLATARPAPVQAAVAAATGSSASRPAAAGAARTYRVRSGETLGHIAQRHGVTVAALRKANGNVDPRRLRVGQTLRIPAGGSAVRPAATRTASAAPARAARVHQVRKGENLSVIARRYGVTVTQIRTWNGLSGSRIIAGQRLRVSA
jgi:membrane-bound lytic murein transglycosylase D